MQTNHFGRRGAFWSGQRRAAGLVSGLTRPAGRAKRWMWVPVLLLGTTQPVMPAGVTKVELVSVSSAGVQGDKPSEGRNDGNGRTTVSADGRFVAFVSDATNLVPGDTNGKQDVFVRDRQTGSTERVSVSTAGVQGDGDSFVPMISADGRFVAFASEADNLGPDDTNGYGGVFVRDRQLGITERISISAAGAQGDDGSDWPSISANGRFVAFHSYATNLAPNDTNGYPDVFVRDRQLGITERINVSTAGDQGDDRSGYPSISADGRFVAFHSYATNLVPGDTNTRRDRHLLDPDAWASISPTVRPVSMSKMRTTPSSQPSTARRCRGSIAHVSVSDSKGPQTCCCCPVSRSHTRSVMSSPEVNNLPSWWLIDRTSFSWPSRTFAIAPVRRSQTTRASRATPMRRGSRR